jgi:predicted GIY-YIG superfamily endonuclease
MGCGKMTVTNLTHDLCYKCWQVREGEDDLTSEEEHFEGNLDSNKIHTAYIMFYGSTEKIGYTNDLNSRIIEIKRKYPNNQLVYFREFTSESQARRFEAWLKKLSTRELTKFVAVFQDKLRKVKLLD